MGALSDPLLQLAARAATQQGGIISGDNPTKYSPTDPLRLWVIQVGIIITFTQLLSLILGKIRQPRVIAEVIGGVLLGPSVMGFVPNFSRRIFPQESIPVLTLTANVGLVFFLFLVGMEIDVRVLKRNVRAASAISIVGLVIPLGMGAALAVPLYNEFLTPDVNRGYFILFVAVAIGITAFPVLCRILTECRLLETRVGIVTLSAGVGNDVVGWILLALAVALVNASSGLTALYVLLAAVAFILFLLLPVRWAYRWLLRKTGSLESGQPTTLVMTTTLLMVLVCGFFTDIVGIHAIFGGFLAGLIIPHDNGFAIAIVEKLEDIISLIFLPIYFTISGLNTNLSFLNNGVTWGYTILIIVFAFVSKFVGCFVTAKLTGFTTRESGAIGSLMSCKGLVELIVLNVGLSAGVLNTRLFSMFVFHAIVLTFMTTPLTLAWYPPQLQTREDGTSVVKKPKHFDGPSGSMGEDVLKSHFAMILNRVEHLPAAMVLAQLLQRPGAQPHAKVEKDSFIRPTVSISDDNSIVKEKVAEPELPALRHDGVHSSSSSAISLSALRLVELTERTSAVLKSQEAAALVSADPLLAVFRTFGRLNRVSVSASLSVCPHEEFPQRVVTFTTEESAEMVVVPWSYFAASDNGVHPIADAVSPLAGTLFNPFDGLFGASKGDKASPSASGVTSSPLSVVYSSFVRKVFATSPIDVALFVDRGSHMNISNSIDSGDHHIFLPFFGGPDDRLALNFVMQLCANPSITATVIRVQKTEGESRLVTQEQQDRMLGFTVAANVGPDTVYGARDTQTQLQSETADNLLWGRYSSAAPNTLPEALQGALNRVAFRELASAEPLHAVLAQSQPGAFGKVERGKSIIALVGRGRRLANESHRGELKSILSSHGFAAATGAELSKTLGDVGAAFVAGTPSQTSVLVVQAAMTHGSSLV